MVANEVAYNNALIASVNDMIRTGGMASYLNEGGDPDPQTLHVVDVKPRNYGKSISIAAMEEIMGWYPKKSMGKIVGYENECAVRLSYTLFISGTNISSMKEFSVSPEGYIRSAKDFALWMTKNYGPPVAGGAISQYGGVQVLTPQEFLDKYKYTNGIIYAEFRYGEGGDGTRRLLESPHYDWYAWG